MREVGGGEGARRKYEWAHKLNSTLFPPSKEYCTCTLYVHYYCIQLFIRLLLRNFQQNSCSAQPGQHSHNHASLMLSCCALQLLQCICVYTNICMHIYTLSVFNGLRAAKPSSEQEER